jgi:hypothetical protein
MKNPRTVLDAMSEQTKLLADIRDSLAILNGVPAKLVRIARKIEDHERRIRDLESRK